jgi:hypothetical protein
VKRLALRSKTANLAYRIDAASSFSAIQCRFIPGTSRLTGVSTPVSIGFRYEVMHAEGALSFIQP